MTKKRKTERIRPAILAQAVAGRIRPKSRADATMPPFDSDEFFQKRRQALKEELEAHAGPRNAVQAVVAALPDPALLAQALAAGGWEALAEQGDPSWARLRGALGKDSKSLAAAEAALGACEPFMKCWAIGLRRSMAHDPLGTPPPLRWMRLLHRLEIEALGRWGEPAGKRQLAKAAQAAAAEWDAQSLRRARPARLDLWLERSERADMLDAWAHRAEANPDYPRASASAIQESLAELEALGWVEPEDYPCALDRMLLDGNSRPTRPTSAFLADALLEKMGARAAHARGFEEWLDTLRVLAEHSVEPAWKAPFERIKIIAERAALARAAGFLETNRQTAPERAAALRL